VLLAHGIDLRDHAFTEGRWRATPRLLVRYGADIEEPSGPGETPFLGAIGWSHFEAAAAMLACGANVDAQNARGMTAAHMMLKKGSDYEHFELLARYGARFDLPNKDGVTAAEIMTRKRDPKFRGVTSITGKKRRRMN
jgi:ankyrin repeat protein